MVEPEQDGYDGDERHPDELNPSGYGDNGKQRLTAKRKRSDEARHGESERCSIKRIGREENHLRPEREKACQHKPDWRRRQQAHEGASSQGVPHQRRIGCVVTRSHEGQARTARPLLWSHRPH